MAGRPKIVDFAVRNSVRKALLQYFAQRTHTSKPELARQIGVTRQALYAYLAADRTPSAETLAKLVDIPGINIVIGGRRLNCNDFPGTGKKRSRPALQSDLFLEPVVAASPDQTLSTKVKRGPKGALRIIVELRVAR